MDHTAIRALTTRLPAELLTELEERRHQLSKTARRRVSTRALVQEALEALLKQEGTSR